jgi:steroid delta-isomerase-like uncharacterized protein
MQDIISQYYTCFNNGDYEGMLALLSDDVLHEPSQGEPRPGKLKFREFLAHMEDCYKEEVIDPVVMTSTDGTRAAAEFMLSGTYLKTDEGLPPARGQRYRLRVGAFFELKNGSITRVSNHYNLQHWLQQISA